MRYLKHVHHLGALLMTLQTGIQLRGVCKAFDGQVVLDNVNLSVPVGKTTSIIGQSGCGKSVLVKLVLGLLTADKGEIHVDGVRVDTEDQQALQQIDGDLSCRWVECFHGLVENKNRRTT